MHAGTVNGGLLTPLSRPSIAQYNIAAMNKTSFIEELKVDSRQIWPIVASSVDEILEETI